MAGIPVASYGIQVEMSHKVQEALLPEYDVVHVVFNLAAAEQELPALMAGDTSVALASKEGSNAGREQAERKAPKILFFSAGIPAETVTKITEAVKAAAPETVIVRPTPEELEAAGATGPDAGVFAKVLKEKFAAVKQ